MVFEPALVKIEPEGIVKLTDKGHNAESIKGMFPAHAAPFVANNVRTSRSASTSPALTASNACRITACTVPLIVVGTRGNLAEAKAIPQVGKAKQVFAALFEKFPTQAAAAKTERS
jgi:hypothetical protein